jgi:hypothetical protein
MAVAIARFIGARTSSSPTSTTTGSTCARKMGATRALNVKTRSHRRRDAASSA